MNSQQDKEKYLQRRKKQIVRSLRLLAKSKCLVTGRFDTGKYFFLTVIIDVMPEKDIVILDYGHDESVNSKLLCAPDVVFTTRYQGIKVRFSSVRVEKSEYRGQTVFVLPIPESLFWLERREFYRVKLPVTNSAVCRIRVAAENADAHPGNLDLRVANIGPSGIAQFLPGKYSYPGGIGTRLSNCTLVLPEHSQEVDLEIRHQTPVDVNEDGGESWIGCVFVEPKEALQSRILQYMHSVERRRKEFER